MDIKRKKNRPKFLIFDPQFDLFCIVVETLILSGTLVEMTFFGVYIYARFAKIMLDSSQLILSVALGGIL